MKTPRPFAQFALLIWMALVMVVFLALFAAPGGTVARFAPVIVTLRAWLMPWFTGASAY